MMNWRLVVHLAGAVCLGMAGAFLMASLVMKPVRDGARPFFCTLGLIIGAAGWLLLEIAKT